jgi:hypothetical protein
LTLQDAMKVLLMLAEVEGEDVALESLCIAFGVKVPRELRGLEDLPPRVALAHAYARRELRPSLKAAASEVLRWKVEDGLGARPFIAARRGERMTSPPCRGADNDRPPRPS